MLAAICSSYFLNSEGAERKAIENHQYDHIVKKANPLCSRSEVEAALDKMANEITDKLQDKNPIFICVLNGAIIPMGHLMTRLNFPLQMDYIHATRYRGKIRGSELQILAHPTSSLEGRTVVLVEDIIDTGVTLKKVVDYCYTKGAERVYTATLVDKYQARAENGLGKADFVGLEIPTKFVVGFGLDYEEYFRNMDGIHAMPLDELF